MNVPFSKNLACFAFLLPPFSESPFCLITDEEPTIREKKIWIKTKKSSKIGQDQKKLQLAFA